MNPEKSGFLSMVLAGALLTAPTPIIAEQTLGTMEGITIALPDGFSCSESVKLRLTAAEPTRFADEDLIVRLARQLAGLMSFDCPAARNIMMEGFVGDSTVYRGLTSEGSGWGVMTMLTPVAPAEIEPEPQPHSGAAGGGLLPALPETAATAAPPAGTPGIAGTEAARRPSAVDRLVGIGGSGATGAASEDFCSEKNFDSTQFKRGRRLSFVFDGNFKALDQSDPYPLKVYLIKLNEFFGKMSFWQPSCARYYEPDLAPGFVNNAMQQMTASPDATAQAGIAILGQIAEMAQNPGGFMARVANLDAEINASEADGALLVGAYSCSSPAFRRLYENLVAYVRNSDPVCASGWPGVKLACISSAVSDGAGVSDARARCGCIVDALENSGLPRETADMLQANYDPASNLDPIVAKDAALRRTIGLCLLR